MSGPARQHSPPPRSCGSVRRGYRGPNRTAQRRVMVAPPRPAADENAQDNRLKAPLRTSTVTTPHASSQQQRSRCRSRRHAPQCRDRMRGRAGCPTHRHANREYGHQRREILGSDRTPSKRHASDGSVTGRRRRSAQRTTPPGPPSSQPLDQPRPQTQGVQPRAAERLPARGRPATWNQQRPALNVHRAAVRSTRSAQPAQDHPGRRSARGRCCDARDEEGRHAELRRSSSAAAFHDSER